MDGGKETPVDEQFRLPSQAQWAFVDDGIYFTGDKGRRDSLAFFDFAAQEVRHVVTVENATMNWGIAISPDERWFLYANLERTADIVGVENFR